MIDGACLCGAVRFRVERVAGPFELCHCTRCRKSSGSVYVAGVSVRTEEFELLAGREQIAEFVLPVQDAPPAYRTFFCKNCGSPAPCPEPGGEWFELPAGLLEGDLGVQVDRHIFVEYRPDWDVALDGLPGFTAEQIREHRRNT